MDLFCLEYLNSLILFTAKIFLENIFLSTKGLFCVTLKKYCHRKKNILCEINVASCCRNVRIEIFYHGSLDTEKENNEENIILREAFTNIKENK